MNILYINHYAGSPQHGMEFRPYYLAREWVRMGHKVTILASSYSHLRQANPDISKFSKSYYKENIEGIDYIWCKTLSYKANGVKRLLNIFDFLSKAYRLRKFIKRELLPDLVIASSTYPFDTILANKIAKDNNAKFYYEVHDLWPLTPMEISGMKPSHPLIRAMQFAEDYGYKHSDLTISMLPNALDYMQEHGLTTSRYKYVPNGIVVSDWLENQQKIANSLALELDCIRSKYKFILGYAGSIGESNAMQYLIEAAVNINPTTAIVIVGSGTHKEQLVKQASDLGLPNVYFFNPVPKYQIPNLLSYFDACYIGWHDYFIYRFGISPNKIFDYMLAAKPIVHSINIDNDFVTLAKCGIVAQAESPESIAKAVNQLASLDRLELEQMGQNAYNYVRAFHDYQKLAEDFIS